MGDLLEALPQLLTDATLMDVHDAGDALVLVVQGLRRDPAGGEVADSTVALHLDGAHTVALGYDARSPATRPSEIAPVFTSLLPWPHGRQPFDVTVGSRMALEDLLCSAQLTWHRGAASTLNDGASLCFSMERDEGPLVLRLWATFATVTARSGGALLDVERWTEEHDAWWDAAAAPVSFADESDEGTITAVVAASSRPPPPMGQKAPAESPFDILPTAAPADLLVPLQRWFTGQVVGDHEACAAAFPDLDRTAEESAARSRSLAADLGTYPFAREVVDWWHEGDRAHARVLGVEHTAAGSGHPGEDCASQWDFELRRRHGAWYVRRFVQGYPHHGSAPPLPPSSLTWLNRWPGPVAR